MFKVIEFEDNGLGIVRDEWITPRKKECWWPPYKVASKFNKCLTSHPIPDENWQVYSVKRIMYETDDLQLAREKCKKAESDSELVSEEEQYKKKRKRKLNVIASDSESEEAEDRINFKYPPPPKRELADPKSKSRKAIVTQHESEFYANTAQSDNDYDITTPTQSAFGGIPIEPESRGNTLIADASSGLESYSPRFPHISKGRILFHDSNIDSPISSRSPCATPTEQKLTAVNKFNVSLDLIASYLADIKNELHEVKATQNDILLRLSSAAPTKTVLLLPNEIDLPLQTIEDLKNLQIWLETKENQENLVNNLSFVGGNKTATITRRILERVFSTSLALQCNWTGKNNKYSLKKIRLIEVIINAVRRNKLAETATDSEITSDITSWFRFARDRDGGREKRRARISQ